MSRLKFIRAIFSNQSPGGIVARRLLPLVIVLPLLGGWVQIAGERAGLFEHTLGTVAFTILRIIFLSGLIIWTAAALNRAEAERRKEADALEQSRIRLDGAMDERQQAEANLLETQHREHSRRTELETLMESAPAIVWIAHDAQCRRMTGNKAAQDLLRMPAEANMSMTAPEGDHPSHFQVFKDGRLLPGSALPMQTAGRQGKAVLGQELEFRFSDGRSLWIYGNATPLRAADGTVRGVISAFVDITSLKEAELELSRSRENLRALAARLQAVREEERTRVAREIHDVLAQQLTRLKMDILWLKRRLAEPLHAANLAAIEERLSGMSELSDQSIDSVQRIATELRPLVLDSLGLCAAIEWQAKDFQAHCGIGCCSRVPEEDLRPDGDSSTALFRILQEALTNVTRHAKATRVEVELRREAGWLVLSAKDNGRGIAIRKLTDPQSLGLIGMRERATLLGGHCSITPCREGGTIVEARLPFHAQNQPGEA